MVSFLGWRNVLQPRRSGGAELSYDAAVLTDGTVVPVEDPAMAGPPIARAPNDVGGLLDTSKGWTLNIPMPSETDKATKTIATKQKDQAAPAETPVVAGQLAAR